MQLIVPAHGPIPLSHLGLTAKQIKASGFNNGVAQYVILFFFDNFQLNATSAALQVGYLCDPIFLQLRGCYKNYLLMPTCTFASIVHSASCGKTVILYITIVCVCVLHTVVGGISDDDVSGMTSVVSLTSVAVCATTLIVLVILTVFIVSRRKRLMSAR